MDAIRSRTVFAALALLGASTAVVVSCNSITGLNDYESVDCFGDCVDASIDNVVPDVVQPDVSVPDADARPEADASAPDADVDADVVDAPEDVGIDVNLDVNLDAEAGLLDPMRRWARWPMPQVENTDAGSLLPGVTKASYVQRTAAAPNDAVEDTVTGLWWDAQASPSAVTYEVAKAYCSGRPSVAGFNWSLPTRIELVTLVDYTRQPTIDPDYFDAVMEEFWTRSPKAGSDDEVWVVSFANGTVKTADNVGTSRRARCVLYRH